MIKRILIVAILCVLYHVPARAQGVNIQFVPEIYGRNINGLLSCQLSNSGAPRPVSLRITVREREAGVICAIKTPVFTLARGVAPVPLSVSRSTAIQFSNNRSGRLLRQSNIFPAGDYEYCYTIAFINSDQGELEQCFDYTLAPFADLMLLDPFDGDSLCNRRPVLTWHPLIPAIPGAFYQLVLTQVKTGQSPTEALSYNLPLVNQRNLTAPVLLYPPVMRELADGEYAWQVTAYKDATVLNRSDIWKFTVGCNDRENSTVLNLENGFRDIVDLARGNDYRAEQSIRFSIINSYEPTVLKYELLPLASISDAIKGLPKVNLQKGLNQVIIDLSGRAGINNGAYYLLRVWLPDGTLQQLRIQYEDKKELK